MSIKPYNNLKAIEYAKKWALGRNPRFFNFDSLGGDCTNFASQILLAGGCIMNYNKTSGWYYINGNDRSHSWTSNNLLYDFLINNKILGPFAAEVDITQVSPGDLVQLNFSDDLFFDHSLVITNVKEPVYVDNIYICSHTRDRLDESLSSINFKRVRFIKILGSYY